MKKRLLNILLFHLFIFGFSQNTQLSTQAEISIVTSGPGDNLYEKFGHTAIRVKDRSSNIDLLYNYGMFDFNSPNFYLNFIKGYMNYKLVKYSFHYSLRDANNDKRWVKQQVLNLNQKEKNKFFHFLEKNALPENSQYLYDPYFDNCATRSRDILQNILHKNLIITNREIVKSESLRSLMNDKININTWGSFGINTALGSRLDKDISLEESTYLPMYLFKFAENAKIKRGATTINLVERTDNLLKFETKIAKQDTISPFLIFSLFLILTSFITYKDLKHKKRTKIFDFIILLLSGIMGILIVFLWFFTNHSTAPNNFNFLWVFAPNFIVAFWVLNDVLKRWVKLYVTFLIFLLIILVFVWISGIQNFTYPLIPLLLSLLIRYLLLYKNNSINS